MKIKFKSTMIKDNENKVIEFISPLERDKWEEFDAYIFKDPNTNIQIRIEVSEDKVNIFQSHATVNLELNTKMSCPFQTEYGELDFIYLLKSLKRENNYITFDYELYSADEKYISSFKIELFLTLV
ncbi:hypothetical protein [Mesomycoplasma lagogenitalium]|uniref:DUF1934 domain-containing protein n=1 Tax=Mesomycoplasma lagogenitalium TaxID=171286 RepID=A0ABY8LTX1_9BACT|nr:hypothetical protein [Mesomycoplasma lagogenitalium]WGI36683.1 hypothetical protein QEG99_00135 [Mesomycoplasma lagogenitalium]